MVDPARFQRILTIGLAMAVTWGAAVAIASKIVFVAPH